MAAEEECAVVRAAPVSKYVSALEIWASVLPARVATEDLGDYLEGLNGIVGHEQRNWVLFWCTAAAVVATGVNGLIYFLQKQQRMWWRNLMKQNRSIRWGLMAVVGFLAIGLALISTTFVEAKPEFEYKFVRLADNTSMPVITDALNREADRGWEVADMAVTTGDQKTIYLIFKK